HCREQQARRFGHRAIPDMNEATNRHGRTCGTKITSRDKPGHDVERLNANSHLTRDDLRLRHAAHRRDAAVASDATRSRRTARGGLAYRSVRGLSAAPA